MADQSGNRLVWAVQGFEGGLVTNYPSHSLPGDFSPDAENFDPSVRYKLKKRLGTSNFSGNHGAPTGTLVRGLGAFVFENGTTVVLAKEGTALYDISAGNWSTTLSGYTPADGTDTYLTMFKNVIVITDSAYVAPRTWSGSGATAALAGSPPAAKYAVSHKGRLWLLNVSGEPSRADHSALNTITDWSTTDNYGSLQIAPGDGMTINGGISDGDTLYISKQSPSGEEGAIYAVTGDGPTEFKPRRIAWFGALSQRAMVLTPQYAVAATSKGIFGLVGTQVLHLSDAIDQTIKDLTAAQRAVISAGALGNQLWIGYPASGAFNTKALVLDTYNRRWSRYAYGAASIAPGIMATHPDGSLYSGSATTTIRVVKHNTGTSDIGTTNISMYWNTPDVDFGQWFADKHVTQWFLHTETSQTGITWTMTHNIDGVTNADSQTITPASGAPVGRKQNQRADKYGRFWQFKIAEASTSAADLFGFQMEAELAPRTR